MNDTLTDLNTIHAKANELVDLIKAAQADHSNMDSLDYGINAIEGFVTDDLMPLKEIQADDDQDSDNGDFYFQERREHEQLAA